MPSTQPEQFATKAEIKRLRALLRERRARDKERVFVCEGPRVIAAALDHGVELLECYVGVDATPEMFAVAERVGATGAPVRGLDVYVVQSTCTPVNDNLVELLVFCDALKRASAGSITARSSGLHHFIGPI